MILPFTVFASPFPIIDFCYGEVNCAFAVFSSPKLQISVSSGEADCQIRVITSSFLLRDDFYGEVKAAITIFLRQIAVLRKKINRNFALPPINGTAYAQAYR